MIVPSMTPQEVYREIDRDLPRLWHWRTRTNKDMARRARTMCRFPQTVWYDHESPRRNRYLFMSIIFGNNFDKNHVSMGTALQKMERGWAVYHFGWPHQERFKRAVLMPHAFDRYAERAAVDKTGIELIKHYIRHNTNGYAASDQQLSGRSVRYKGRDNFCLAVTEGVLLGEMDGDIFVARTFITYDMTAGLQRDAFEWRRNRLMTQQEMAKYTEPLPEATPMLVLDGMDPKVRKRIIGKLQDLCE